MYFMKWARSQAAKGSVRGETHRFEAAFLLFSAANDKRGTNGLELIPHLFKAVGPLTAAYGLTA
jgi:hypothetical protein